MPEQKTLFSDLMRLYEGRLTDIVGEVLNNDRLVRALQVVLTTSEDVRRLIIKAIETAMINLQLPTGTDFARLYRKVDELDERLFDLRAALHDLSHGDLAAPSPLDARLVELERQINVLAKLVAGQHSPAAQLDRIEALLHRLGAAPAGVSIEVPESPLLPNKKSSKARRGAASRKGPGDDVKKKGEPVGGPGEPA